MRSYLYHYFERPYEVRAFLHAHLESTIPVKALVSLKDRNKGITILETSLKAKKTLDSFSILSKKLNDIEEN